MFNKLNEKNMDKKSNAKKVKKENPKKTVLEIPEKIEGEQEKLKMRQILIETNGNEIRIAKNETAGKLELLAILQALIGSLTSPK